MICLNGHWQSESLLPLHDAGFVMGATVTDLIRTYSGKPFLLNEHLERFRQSCELCRIRLPAIDWPVLVERLIETNRRGDEELGIVLFATPGPVGMYAGQPGRAGDGEPTWGLHSFPLPLARHEQLRRDGVRLFAVHGDSNVDPRAKHRSRLHWWIASQEARAIDPRAEAVLVDRDGCVTETASANLLLFKDGEVIVPPAERVLPGITMGVVLGQCSRHGIKVSQRIVTVADALAADEILLTCTSWGLASASHFNGEEKQRPGWLEGRIDLLAESASDGKTVARTSG